MRRILIERARRLARAKHGGGQWRMTLDEQIIAAEPQPEAVLALDDALSRLSAQDPEMARWSSSISSPACRSSRPRRRSALPSAPSRAGGPRRAPGCAARWRGDAADLDHRAGAAQLALSHRSAVAGAGGAQGGELGPRLDRGFGLEPRERRDAASRSAAASS